MADATNVGTEQAPELNEQRTVTANEGAGTAPEQEQAGKEQNEAPAEQATEAPAEQAPVDDGMAELARLVAELGGASKVAEALRTITANAAEQKAELVSALASNAACAFSADDLRGMTVDQLRKLDRSLRPAHYGTRPASNTVTVPEGGFVHNGAIYRPYVAPTIAQ